MCDSHTPEAGLEPPTHTVPSGSSSALEWYIRGYAIVPAGDHVCVAGSNISALSAAVVASLNFSEPPRATILPFGRRTAFIVVRFAAIGGRFTHCSGHTSRSIISTVFVAP